MMDDAERTAVKEIMVNHGYGEFSPDKVEVRYKGQGKYGEHISVRMNRNGLYSLWVRKGGWEKLQPIKAIMGGERGGSRNSALEFRGLDLDQLDDMIARLLNTLERLKAHDS